MTTPISKLRYLWAYSAVDEWTESWHQRLLGERRNRGYDVRGFCVTPPTLGRHWLPFPKLDRLWRMGDRALLGMYEQLATALDGCDVLVLYNGANLHPEFVRMLSALKVYAAADDPESTAILTRPVAPAFDIHLVNNAACVELYRSWGLREVHFWPLGSQVFPEDVADLSEPVIRDAGRRPVPVVFFGERVMPHRRERLEQLVRAFPLAYCAGRGWPDGYVSWGRVWATYRLARIGWNIHNSLGPVNFRTYDLPAHGVMQICDNQNHLTTVFEPGREVVGFDSVDECIDLTRFYLAHPEKERDIAVAGWHRWRRDYTPARIWDRLVAIVEAWRPTQLRPGDPARNAESIRLLLRRHARRQAPLRTVWRLGHSVKSGFRRLAPLRRTPETAA